MVGNGAKLTASFELSNIPTLHHAVLLTNILNIHFHAPITINGVVAKSMNKSHLFSLDISNPIYSPIYTAEQVPRLPLPHIEYFTKLTSLCLC